MSQLVDTAAAIPSASVPTAAAANAAAHHEPATQQSIFDSLTPRADFRTIARWVEPRSSVLDLGCGDGSLLSILQAELEIVGYGIEINDAGVLACAEKGVNVIQQNLE